MNFKSRLARCPQLCRCPTGLPGRHCVTSTVSGTASKAGSMAGRTGSQWHFFVTDTIGRINSHWDILLCCCLSNLTKDLTLLKPNCSDYPTITHGPGGNGVNHFWPQHKREGRVHTEIQSISSKPHHKAFNEHNICVYLKVRKRIPFHWNVLQPKLHSNLFSRLSSGWAAAPTEDPREPDIPGGDWRLW